MNKFLLIIIVVLYTNILYAQDVNDFFRQRESLKKSVINQEFATFMAVSLEEDSITQEDLTGKITIINFWFTGCAPCIAEFEALNDLYYQFENYSDFYFLSFTTDGPENAKETANKYKLPYNIYSISREEISRLNFNMGFPTNIILNKERKVLFLESGGSTDPDRAKKFVEEIKQIIADNLKTEE